MVSKNVNAFGQGTFNFFTLLLIIVAVIGTGYGFITQTDAGLIYAGIFIVFISLIVLIQFFINENDKKLVKNYFKTPFYTSPLLAMTAWIGGILIITSINVFGKLFNQGFSTTNFFSPVFSATGIFTGSSQSFQAALVEASEIGNWFYGVFVAGTIEELIWAFIIPAISYTITILMVKQLLNGKVPFGMKSENFHFTIAMIVSVGTFMFIHSLNDTYTGAMFLIAGMFRFLMNVSIYKWALGLAFTIGIHNGNNNIAYISVKGFSVWFSTLFGTVYGLVFVALFVVALIIVIINLANGNIIKLLKKERLI